MMRYTDRIYVSVSASK